MKAYKTQIKPSDKQRCKIRETIGVCRYIYNFYIAHNKQVYEKDKSFMSANEFSVWLNNVYIPENPDKKWIRDASSKAVKQSIRNAEIAFKRFFRGLSGFPKFKKKRNQDVKMYFVKNDAKTVIECERHKIKIPTLGCVRLKEYGYIPRDEIIKSGAVSEKAGRFYVSVLTGENPDTVNHIPGNTGVGIGVDLGLKELAVISNGQVFENINKTKKIKELEKRLRREQRSLSRKYENKKKRKEELTKRSANIEKNVHRVQKIHDALSRKRQEYVRYVVRILVKTKPKYITIEDLNISGMMKNKHLSKAIAGQNFYYFRKWLEYKCKQFDIELRVADRFYPSSKLCSKCGKKKADLKLKDRVYICDCGIQIDRDLNAAINLERCTEYKTA
ncbi:MAG: transposase [Syntrophomonadaceae bacterium]|jgi:putative transposase|nr:transposase [Syntrophomonadaceae bacterium]